MAAKAEDSDNSWMGSDAETVVRGPSQSICFICERSEGEHNGCKAEASAVDLDELEGEDDMDKILGVLSDDDDFQES